MDATQLDTLWTALKSANDACNAAQADFDAKSQVIPALGAANSQAYTALTPAFTNFKNYVDNSAYPESSIDNFDAQVATFRALLAPAISAAQTQATAQAAADAAQATLATANAAYDTAFAAFKTAFEASAPAQ